MKIKKEGKEEVRMRFIITKDYDELSQVISSTMLKHMHTDKPRVNICVTTGTTPIQAYQILAPKVKDKAYFEHVHYYVVDEFWYAKEPGTQNEDIPVNKMSMDLKFFQAANIPEERIHTLQDDNVETFDQAIQQAGGMDMVLMGIGTDGHFCGNHPGTFDDWKQGCHSIDRYCTPQVNELLEFLLKDDIHSEDVSRIPDHYLTMGPKTIMDAKHIVMIFSGEGKAETVRRACFEPITMDFPVSIFQLHPHVRVLLDEAAAAKIRQFI